MKCLRGAVPKGTAGVRWMKASEMRTPREERLPPRCNNLSGECGSVGGAKLWRREHEVLRCLMGKRQESSKVSKEIRLPMVSKTLKGITPRTLVPE